MTPYYLKVQEYNNAERRDLWEYELDLSPEEVRRMVLSVFEVGRHRITYFYFDDNCAYILMSILDVGRPTLNLAEEFKFWVTPAQTVRAVQSKRGLVKHLGYRASSFTRFQSRFLALNDQEGKILGEIFSAADGEPLPKTLLAASSECQTRVLDAALEYVDYRERLAGTKIAVTHAKLRKELLNARAKTEIPSPSFTYVDYSKRPDQGHGPLRLGMGISSNPDRPIGLTAEFRPVLHDLSALALGYSSELEIKFFDIKLGMDLIERSLRLDHFTLFEVMSLPSVRPMLTPISWHLDIGALSIPRCVGGDSRCTEKFLQGGAGLTYRFFKDRLGIYALGMASMGTGTQEGWYFAPGLLTGILARLDESVKFHTSLLVLEHLLGVKATDIRWKTELAWAISSFSELRPVALLANGAAEFGISSYWYF